MANLKLKPSSERYVEFRCEEKGRPGKVKGSRIC